MRKFTEDKFMTRVRLAQYFVDIGNDLAAEVLYKKAIDVVPMNEFSLRHVLAIRELGEVMCRLGRDEEGQGLQILAAYMFDTLADEVCQKAVAGIQSRAS